MYRILTSFTTVHAKRMQEGMQKRYSGSFWLKVSLDDRADIPTSSIEECSNFLKSISDNKIAIGGVFFILCSYPLTSPLLRILTAVCPQHTTTCLYLVTHHSTVLYQPSHFTFRESSQNVHNLDEAMKIKILPCG